MYMNLELNIKEKIMKKSAFTLAETLITLGVIGVVAAMTLPLLIQSYKNSIAETRLKKVYSVMNQAIQRAEADYGAKELWNFEDEAFWDKYFDPYLKVLKTEIIDSNPKYRLVYFMDGSILAGKASGKVQTDGTIKASGMNQDYFFFPNGKFFNISALNEDKKASTGVTLFPFRFAPIAEFDNKNIKSFHYHKGFMPYAHNWDGEVAPTTLGYTYACAKQNKSNQVPNWCTLYIMQNGWKIPKDYPFKVK